MSSAPSETALEFVPADMRRALKLHPNSRCTAVTRIEVDVARPHPGNLVLDYLVTGKIRDLRMPPPARSPSRGHELWQHTCFEAFVRALPATAYYELNFAPSRQWAAYQFDAYRSGMTVANEVGAPRIDVQSSGESCRLRISLDLEGMRILPDDDVWRLALSAVIEETSGQKSYWALKHPPGKADFHYADGFTLELPVQPL